MSRVASSEIERKVEARNAKETNKTKDKSDVLHILIPWPGLVWSARLQVAADNAVSASEAFPRTVGLSCLLISERGLEPSPTNGRMLLVKSMPWRGRESLVGYNF